MDASGFMSAVGGLVCWLPVLLGLLEPHAVISTRTAIVAAPRLMPSLPPLVEHVCVIRSPGQPHRPVLELVRVAQGVHILTYRHELLPAVEADEVARAPAHVDHLFDLSTLDRHPRRGLLTLGEHADLLGPHDKADPVPEEHIRDADEAGDD